jgi:glycosyltransferase involved in cell wall biosynthesis
VKEFPLVSIVTPSFNMASYLGETIESVLSQDYPNIEYVVMDGGSTDGTLDLLNSYKGRLRYTSGPDGGTADAVNQGFKSCQGSIFAWLNADDTYLPGAISAAVRHFSENSAAAAVYGQAYWVDESGTVLKPYPTTSRSMEMLPYDCYICQPACFLRSTAFKEVGGLNAGLAYAFDYDLWSRLAKGHKISYLESYLATARMHAGNKSLRDRSIMFREGMHVLKQHFGYIPFHWIYSHICFRLDKRDQFYESLNPSLISYCLSLPVGLYRNLPHVPTYCREWWQVMSLEGFLRTWNRARGRKPQSGTDGPAGPPPPPATPGGDSKWPAGAR